MSKESQGPFGPKVGKGWPVMGLFFVLAWMPAIGWGVVHSDLPTWRMWTLLALLTLYAVGYLVLPFLLWGRPVRNRLFAIFAHLGVGIALVIGLGLDSMPLLIYALAMASFALPTRPMLMINGGTLAGFAVIILVTSPVHGPWSSWVTLISITGCLSAMGRMLHVNRRLQEAQAEIAALAVSGERARLARDLHDILGHSLTTITLKAGLARRVLETSDDRDRAMGEIREVEELSRQALGDVRATVSGYREVSLSGELVGARAALRAAEVAADLPHAVDNVRPELQQAFGYVLREGVTNVLRHSQATRCEVRLGENWLEVRDNGRSSCAKVTSSRDSGGGNGLSGLADRVAEVGGTIEAGPLPEGGFSLRVRVGEIATGDQPEDRTDSVVQRRTSQVRPSVGLA
ncbi:sensor histidine kinase [Solihabitans fulvus]|nr:histidine kinase [Solihabitans fulvus]